MLEKTHPKPVLLSLLLLAVWARNVSWLLEVSEGCCGVLHSRGLGGFWFLSHLSNTPGVAVTVDTKSSE